MRLPDLPPSVWLWVAAARVVIGILAIPLAPFLYREHFVVLILMRPTKEVLVAAGFLVKTGKVALIPVVLAAVPLMVLGVWLFFHLGRLYAKDIEKGQVAGIGGRVVSPQKVARFQKMLDRRGPRLIFLGRLAAISSAMVAAAAGAGKMRPAEFLPVDALGAITSAAIAMGAGYVLGDAYGDANPILTATGVILLVAVAFLLRRYLQKL